MAIDKMLVQNIVPKLINSSLNCVAMRFAYQKIKLCLAHILPKYRFETIEGLTPDRLRFKRGTAGLFTESFKIRVVKR